MSHDVQVIVQSEEEKQLRKQIRKEEKKINRLLTKGDDDEEEEEDFKFDPVDLRIKRQMALATAASAPILKDRGDEANISIGADFLKIRFSYNFISIIIF